MFEPTPKLKAARVLGVFQTEFGDRIQMLQRPPGCLSSQEETQWKLDREAKEASCQIRTGHDLCLNGML
jgi:hypothetical protein